MVQVSVLPIVTLISLPSSVPLKTNVFEPDGRARTARRGMSSSQRKLSFSGLKAAMRGRVRRWRGMSGTSGERSGNDWGTNRADADRRMSMLLSPENMPERQCWQGFWLFLSSDVYASQRGRKCDL